MISICNVATDKKIGMTFAELVRALDAPKSSVHGFISGLLASGWLYQEQHRFYLGPAVYALTLASGRIRAGLVTHEDLVALQQQTGVAVSHRQQVDDPDGVDRRENTGIGRLPRRGLHQVDRLATRVLVVLVDLAIADEHRGSGIK